MKSELFKESYCVFVDSEHSKYYNELLKQKNLIEKSVRVLNASFDKTLSCIVIPTSSNHRYNIQKIIEILWNNKKDGGFWHQYGIGYEGKEWEVCT